MAYIPGYEHDLFISYARVDNMTPSKSERGWIDGFLDILRVQLGKHIGRFDAVRLWQDERLDGNQLFDDVIKDCIDKSAIFLAFTSFGYLDSKYCQKELAWFYKKAQSEKIGLDVANRRRIVNILLYNIPHQQWPDAYGRATGFDFHDANRPDDPGEPCDISSELFRIHRRKLVVALVELIKAMAQPDSGVPETKASAGQLFDVYMAEVTDTLRHKRRRLMQRFIQEGVTLYQKVPPPHESKKHEQAVVQALGNSTLCVNMLDHLAGAEIEGEVEMTYPRKQAMLGFEHARSQLIWTPRDLDIESVEDEEHKKFLYDLENPAAIEKSYDFIRAPADELYRVILDRLEEIKAPATPQAFRAALIDTHEKDEAFVFDITRSLLEKNIVPYINPIVDDPRSSIELLKERLKSVNAVVILYGKVGAEWVIARLEEMIKIVFSENIPIKSFCIYLAPPDKDPKNIRSKYPFLNTRVLENQYGFNPATLQPLFSDLGLGG
jgi:hypothetical protein